MVPSISMDLAIYAVRSSSCNLSHWENVYSRWTSAVAGHDNSNKTAAYLNTGASTPTWPGERDKSDPISINRFPAIRRLKCQVCVEDQAGCVSPTCSHCDNGPASSPIRFTGTPSSLKKQT